MAIIKAKYRGLDDAAHNLVLISSQTASADSSVEIEFTGSYKEYIIKFSELNPSADLAHIKLNFSKDSGANYNCTKQHGGFKMQADEADTSHVVDIDSTIKGILTTSNVDFMENVGGASDEHASGEIKVFNPHSTTFHKLYTTNTVHTDGNNNLRAEYCSGYVHEPTTAITHIKIVPSSGTIDGLFTLYGVKT